MQVNTVIVEKLDIDGTVKTFTMEADRRYALWIALANEYEDPREGPFHFLDRRYAEKFSRKFVKCPVRRVGKNHFGRSDNSYEFRTSWQRIPTKENELSYYALSLPKYAVPKEICITDPMQQEHKYQKEVIRDDQKECFVIYLKCSSRYGSFNFDLSCNFYIEEKNLFKVAEYQDSLTTDYGFGDVWKYGLESRKEANKIEHFLDIGVFGINKKATLIFGEGNINDGFHSIIAQIITKSGQISAECFGKLPPSSELLGLYSDWQSMYKASLGINRKLDEIPGMVANYSHQDLNDLSQRLENQLNQWLRSEQFIPIGNILREKFKGSDQFQIFIQSQNPDVQKLPWHLWEFFKPYCKAEIALSAPFYDRVEKIVRPRNKIRILSILGNSQDIDINPDREIISTLVPKAKFLDKPNRQQLDTQLRSEKGWDILCFSGHSSSTMDSSRGYFYINDTDKLTIPDLKYALQTAIARGLQIAIFNSCDGLGLARQLAELHIPQIIVFREPVPDRVAQEFLKNFLTDFASGKSFYLAVREAREKLHPLEQHFPCATWLPVICQHPAEVSPTWR